jgi:lysophospholipase L1-like esterase
MTRWLRVTLIGLSVAGNVLLLVLATCVAVPPGRAYLRRTFGRLSAGEFDPVHYRAQVAWLASCPTRTGGVVVAGDSQAMALLGDTALHYLAGDLNPQWTDLIATNRLRDRAVAGDTVTGLLQRLPDITRLQPDRLVLDIGINDLIEGRHPQEVLRNYGTLLARVREQLPRCRVTITLLPPVNESSRKWCSNSTIADLNRGLAALAAEQYAAIVDLAALVPKTPDGSLSPAVSDDGLHLKSDAMVIWRRALSALFD